MDAIPPEVPIDERNEPRLKTSTPADKTVLFVQVTYGHMHYPVSQAPPFHPMVLIEQMIEVSGRGAAPHTVATSHSFGFFFSIACRQFWNKRSDLLSMHAMPDFRRDITRCLSRTLLSRRLVPSCRSD